MEKVRERYLATIGLEVHVQINTKSKLFCGCALRYGSPPNTLCCPVCLGLPGALPVLNQGAIEKTILAGLMLECEVTSRCKWDRKNYYYPDLAKNYQISQYDLPLCRGGAVPLYDLAYPKDAQKEIAHPGKKVSLNRIHLEEDVAKSTHHETTSTIDFNRAGTPLLEIVSEAEIHSPEEAVAYLNSLKQILVYGGISDADMEKGQMRCDVNVSVRPQQQEEWGAKVELKNLNSVSGVRRALHHEIERQIEELEAGRSISQTTRRWDDDAGKTILMRTKEDAHDYRYFPDPDLLPVETAEMVEKMHPLLPELPHEKRDRYVKDFTISAYDAGVLASDLALADYFERAAKGATHPKKVANWIINNLLSALNETGKDIQTCTIAPEFFDTLAGLIEEGKISSNQGKEVFQEMFSTGKAPQVIVQEKGMEQVSNTDALEAFIDQVIAENGETVERIKQGNHKAINFLKGQVMKLSKGQANPKVVGALLEQKLLR